MFNPYVNPNKEVKREGDAGKARTHIRIQIHDYTYFQEHLKYQVLLHDPSLNRDFVDKYVAKYYNKFKYCDVMK